LFNYFKNSISDLITILGDFILSETEPLSLKIADLFNQRQMASAKPKRAYVESLIQEKDKISFVNHWEKKVLFVENKRCSSI